MGADKIPMIAGWLFLGIALIAIGFVLIKKSRNQQSRNKSRFAEMRRAQENDDPACHEPEFQAEMYSLQQELRPTNSILTAGFSNSGTEAMTVIGAFLVLGGGFVLAFPLLVIAMTHH